MKGTQRAGMYHGSGILLDSVLSVNYNDTIILAGSDGHAEEDQEEEEATS